MAEVVTSYRLGDKKLRVRIVGLGSAYLKPNEAIELAAGMLRWAIEMKHEAKIRRMAKKWKVKESTVRNLRGR